MDIPIDIMDRLYQDYGEESMGEAFAILRSRWVPTYHITFTQAARSLLHLADGDLERLKALANYDDPRDIVMEAEEAAGNQGHWFSISFNEIAQLGGRKYTMPHRLPESDDLPF